MARTKAGAVVARTITYLSSQARGAAVSALAKTHGAGQTMN